jgi:hypothetical protein
MQTTHRAEVGGSAVPCTYIYLLKRRDLSKDVWIYESENCTTLYTMFSKNNYVQPCKNKANMSSTVSQDELQYKLPNCPPMADNDLLGNTIFVTTGHIPPVLQIVRVLMYDRNICTWMPHFKYYNVNLFTNQYHLVNK